jgi:AcrR family transcriptional regulator
MTVMANRRERVRAATVQEIKDVARRKLVTEGPTAVSLRAIAREMGMTAPALYRYFPSFDHLVRALVADLFAEVCAAMEDARDLVPADDVDGRLIAVCRTFRAWSVGHRAEFGLLFNTPMPGAGCNLLPTPQAGGARFGAIFFELFADVWERRPFRAPDATELDPTLVRQLVAYRDAVGSTLPIGVTYVILSCWMRLYGLVSLEVLNHLRFALDDAEPFFEEQLRVLAQQLGLAPVGASARVPATS